jgi:tRNA threonylcarbamoyladenosine biosynthesis protein TsaE
MVTVPLHQLHSFAQEFWRLAGHTKGKTTLIEALCSAKGVKEHTSSPTFSIINQYAYTEGGEEKTIYHIDLYRLKDEEEIIQAGVEDCVYSGNICMIEWPQKAPDLFDEKVAKITIESVSETERTIKMELPQAV